MSCSLSTLTHNSYQKKTDTYMPTLSPPFTIPTPTSLPPEDGSDPRPRRPPVTVPTGSSNAADTNAAHLSLTRSTARGRNTPTSLTNQARGEGAQARRHRSPKLPFTRSARRAQQPHRHQRSSPLPHQVRGEGRNTTTSLTNQARGEAAQHANSEISPLHLITINHLVSLPIRFLILALD
jgi:hypothetical protein